MLALITGIAFIGPHHGLLSPSARAVSRSTSHHFMLPQKNFSESQAAPEAQLPRQKVCIVHGTIALLLIMSLQDGVLNIIGSLASVLESV